MLLALICVAFIVSIIQRQWRGGSLMADRSLSSPPGLLIDYRDESPVSAIEVEVLNGCGIPGLAQKFTDFLRTRQVDVINSDNADHFDYEKTLIIQRNQFVERSYRMAEILSIPKSDTTRILIRPDLSLATDVTVILGKDYNQIKPFRQFLSRQP